MPEASSGSDGLATDVGVTPDACPEAVNPQNGCIYLGTLSDLTEGPFAPLGVEVVAGVKAFWQRVNEAGGIGGHDVDVSEYVRDNKYDPEQHASQYAQISESVLALAQTLGTSTTMAVLPSLERDDVLAVPASWWSGWAFEDAILESGHSYCVGAMNGLDFADAEFVDGGVQSVMVVHYPGDYGADAAAGVGIWATANEVPFDPSTQAIETQPNRTSGNQDGPVGQIVERDPSVVYLATGPLEAAEIIGKAEAAGYDGRFVGALPTFNPAMLQAPELAAVLPSVYRLVAPWAPFGASTPAHQAMTAAVGEDLPTNDGFTSGWILQYPLKAAIEQAVANGDLTRAGLRRAAVGLVVDYEGALPPTTYGDAASTPRGAVIAAPNPDAPMGVSQVKELFTGPTAQAHEATGPCSQPS